MACTGSAINVACLPVMPTLGSYRMIGAPMGVLKTLAQKVADLEDHLFLVNEALRGMESGTIAHLRALAAEVEGPSMPFERYRGAPLAAHR